jgi:multidrug efflux pump subunit AcrB
MWIVRFALRFPHTFYVLAMLILFLGVSAIVGMPTEIFPEINIPVVSVIWQYTGLSTPEMEQRVTTYSEYSISSNVNGIKDMEVAVAESTCAERSPPSNTVCVAIAPSDQNSCAGLNGSGINPV